MKEKIIHLSRKSGLPFELTKSGVLSNSTRALFETAIGENMKVTAFWDSGIWRFSKGKKSVLSRGFNFPINTVASTAIAGDKNQAKLVWREAGVPTPEGFTVDNKNASYTEINKIKLPVVIKPTRDTFGGEGVVTNITKRSELKNYIRQGLKKYDELVVESYHGGLKEYRVCILDGEVFGFAEKKAPNIVGDGKKTIEKLVDEKNTIRERELGPFGYGLIPKSDEIKKHLGEQKLTFKSVPKKHQEIILSNVKNVSSGGEPLQIDKSRLPKKTLALCLKAVDSLGLRLAGLDILSPDIITSPFVGVFLEANWRPGYSIHYGSDIGMRKMMYTKLLKAMFANIN